MSEKKKSEFIQVTVQLRKEDVAKLDGWAHRAGISRSSVLRLMIEDRKTVEAHK